MISISYHYQDGNGYTRQAQQIFSNPHKLTVSIVQEQLRIEDEDNRSFIASQVNLPDLFHYTIDCTFDPDHDHCWHQIDAVTETDSMTNETRNIDQFISAWRTAQQTGWKDFNPRALLIHRPDGSLADSTEIQVMTITFDEPVEINGQTWIGALLESSDENSEGLWIWRQTYTAAEQAARQIVESTTHYQMAETDDLNLSLK